MSEGTKTAMIPEQVFNALVEYMVARPYTEVSHIIDAMKANVQLVDSPTEQEAEEEDGETE
jgi:hypothetical protein